MKISTVQNNTPYQTVNPIRHPHTKFTNFISHLGFALYLGIQHLFWLLFPLKHLNIKTNLQFPYTVVWY